jgi:hypothetical protein
MSEEPKPIVFTRHALERCAERGATEADVAAAVRNGQSEPAQRGLWLYRLNLEFQSEWDGVRYAVKQVAPVVDEEEDRFVVVTVYTYYF